MITGRENAPDSQLCKDAVERSAAAARQGKEDPLAVPAGPAHLGRGRLAVDQQGTAIFFLGSVSHAGLLTVCRP